MCNLAGVRGGLTESVGTGKDFTAAQKKNIFRRKYEKEWWKL
jgi:hypothetical protein